MRTSKVLATCIASVACFTLFVGCGETEGKVNEETWRTELTKEFDPETSNFVMEMDQKALAADGTVLTDMKNRVVKNDNVIYQRIENDPEWEDEGVINYIVAYFTLVDGTNYRYGYSYSSDSNEEPDPEWEVSSQRFNEVYDEISSIALTAYAETFSLFE